MSSREIERPEYEHGVVSWFRGHLLGDQTGVFHPGKESGSKTCGSKMPGRRRPWSSRSGTPTVPNACSAVERTRGATGAVATTRPYRDAPEGWVEIVAINLQGGTWAFGLGVPRKCDPGSVTWI